MQNYPFAFSICLQKISNDIITVSRSMLNVFSGAMSGHCICGTTEDYDRRHDTSDTKWIACDKPVSATITGTGVTTKSFPLEIIPGGGTISQEILPSRHDFLGNPSTQGEQIPRKSQSSPLPFSDFLGDGTLVCLFPQMVI